MDYDKLAKAHPEFPREELEALGRVWEDPVTHRALRKLLTSFRVPACSALEKILPDAVGALSIARRQGEIGAIDALWGTLEDLFTEKEENDENA